MKILNKYLILAAGAAMVLGSCDDNAWNDHLDGFTVPPVDGSTPTEEYTLTPDDYKTIASLTANTALAEKLGQEDALKAIGTNGCFATQEEARNYIPALLATTDKDLPYYALNNGSSVNVTFNLDTNLPEAVQAINAGVLTYAVTDNDYEHIWDTEDYMPAFAPSHSAAEYLPAILKSCVEATAGQYVVVSFRTTSVEPDLTSGAPLPESTPDNAVYLYDGSAWAPAAGLTLVKPDEYQDIMGQSYANLNYTQAGHCLPIYLKQKFPYAQADDTKIIVFNMYVSGATTFKAREYAYDGSEWTLNMGAETFKFTKSDNEWGFNPSIEIELPYVRNTPPTSTYYMGCVQWVLDNIVKPEKPDATLTTAEPWIDYRGNAEFYSGASAFYGNVDVRAATAKKNMPEGYTGYDGLSDDQISDLLMKRFCLETMRGSLESIHSDISPVEGMEVTISVKFVAYTPATREETVVYTVVAPGKLKYKSCTWFKKGEDAGWE